MGWVQLAQDSDQLRAVMHTVNELPGFKTGLEFLGQLIYCRFLERNFALWSTTAFPFGV